jgi:predicted patatin/cPLA2 family phospholipase
MRKRMSKIANEFFPVNIIYDLFKKTGIAKRKALVLEGGAMRGVFTCGVLSVFNDRRFMPWDIIVGTSAGAINGAAYAAGQIHLSRDAYFIDLLRGDFINIKNILNKNKHVLDLDWMVKEIVLGEEALNLRTLRRRCPVIITATHIPEYEEPRTIYLNSKRDDIITSLKATAALPLLYRGFIEYDGYSLLDGGVLDPIPYAKPLEMGYKEEEIVVVLTRPKGYRKKEESFWIRKLTERYYREEKFKPFIDVLNNRFKRYNKCLDDLEKKYKGIHVIYPPKNYSVDNLSRDRAQMLTGFTQGIMAGRDYLKGIW